MEQDSYDNTIDKIREKIVELRSRQNVGVLECLDIIDKYKTGMDNKRANEEDLDKFLADARACGEPDEDRKITNNRGSDGAIVYKPHCSKCGAAINERVSYRNIITECGSYKNLAHPTTEVSPSRCRCCNQPFDRIEIQIPEQQPTEYLI